MDERLEGVQLWHHCKRFQELYEEARSDMRITFSFGTEASETLIYRRGLDVINARLDRGYFTAFKFGLTHIAHWHFTNPRYGYCWDGCTEFILICCSSNAAMIGRLETRYISLFRRWD